MANRSALVRLLATPENRAALTALQDVLHTLTSDTPATPIFLHGPSGSGKTFLVETLVKELHCEGFEICSLSANDFADKTDFSDAEEADLLVVEDLQHLPTRYQTTLTALIDERTKHDRAMIFTASHGPGRLRHRGTLVPRRLATRFAAGLVVGLEPMQCATRRRLLEVFAADAQLPAAPEILDWLAEHLVGGGRQLEGAVQQWKSLQRLRRRPLRLDELRAHFRPQMEATVPTVQHIAEHVSASFRVPTKQVVSARRAHEVLLPRQVSMYLARQLTNLSLVEIGKYFGGRDHKTVQHACKKVESAMKTDASLSGTVRQLRAELQ